MALGFEDAAYLQKSGAPLSGLEVYQSLVEHFEGWAEAVEGTHGLCLLEVMSLDVPTTTRHFSSNVSFHFDILEALSRQYLVPPTAFAMALAEAGLFSAAGRPLLCYPSSGDYCRILGLHLTRQPLRVRLAEESDLAPLLGLQELAVPQPGLRASEAVLRKRLLGARGGAFVAESFCGRLLGAIYTARVAEGFGFIAEPGAGEELVAEADCLQIVGLHADPASPSVGSHLCRFALQLAHLEPAIRSVVGISRCDGWHCSNIKSQEEYVEQHRRGELSDRILAFHTSQGAEIVRLIPDARPSDVDNMGAGVLIRYDPGQVLRRPQQPTAHTLAEGRVVSLAEVLTVLRDVLAELGAADATGSSLSLAELGLDSLELLELRERLAARFALRRSEELPVSLLSQSSSTEALAAAIHQRLSGTWSVPKAGV
ncbi:unnamed protein product, partial [Polarella glacialis]